MKFNDFCGEKLSALGFGTMRLPLADDKKTIDKDAVAGMVEYAIDHGINYFDTAAPYHDGKSESVIGEILCRYPRGKFNLATKFPGHQHMKEFKPAGTFESQLRKCRVDYFDFYLMHNMCENSIDDYMNPKWGILEYFVEQKRLGRIRHLGFSCHAHPDLLEEILDGPYGEHMEFCQIQLNYLDWNLQEAFKKIEMLRKRNIPVWVMEPLRGGKLARLSDAQAAELKGARPDESVASWAFRWLQDIPGVTVVLSGMSSFEQMVDNVKTFETDKPLSSAERGLLEKVAGSMLDMVPCTACRYCCEGCPAGLDIPYLLSCYNDLKLEITYTPLMKLEILPQERRPSSCLGCGACSSICPQGIDIPGMMSSLAETFEKYPKWSELCVQRNAIAESESK